MRLDICRFWGVALTVTLLAASLEARRVRVQPTEEDEDLQYYGEPQDSQGRGVVLVGDDYNGLYGQAAGGGRSAQDNYIPQPRGGARAQVQYKDSRANVKEASKAPPVQTIRNYNKVNDDGSFTFGYEAADGSFKEETRGTDCVVRGKYGYVDPDGNKREFTYVSGNPCDPNAAKEEEDESRERGRPEEDSAEPENVPANYPSNYPTRPIRPLRPAVQATPAPLPPPRPVAVYHQAAYQQEEDDEQEQPEPEQILRAQPVQPTRHRLLPVRPTYVPEERPLVQHRARVSASSTPATYRDEPRQVSVTPRPVTVTPAPPATTYRPQLLQVAVTPRPALLYTTKQLQPARTPHYPSSTAATPGAAALDFLSEFQRFQHDNQITPSTPRPVVRTTTPTPHSIQPNSNPVYSSELVFDPASGQYKTQLYQTLPQTEGDFTLNHRIQPYVHQPARQLVNIQQLQQQSPLYRGPTATASAQNQGRTSGQAAYQQQQADLQFQNSQQLFAQQQRARAQQRPAQAQPVRTEPQQFYYIQPQALQQQGISSGQIDAFLRGHNIQF